MNNLHRELAPISDKAWAQIEEEASRTLKCYLAARRVIDVSEPKGFEFPGVGTGHSHQIKSLENGVQANQREFKASVELRVPFELQRQAVDDVERGSLDSDWSPLKEAAQKIAFAEDRAVFDGYPDAGIEGIRQGSSNTSVTLPSDIKAIPDAIEKALNQLRLAGVNGPYSLILDTSKYAAISGGSDDGYPVLQHIQRLVDGNVVYAPAIEGGLLLTSRGGDFTLDLGQDISIGYLGHGKTSIELYLQETFSFRILTAEAAVSLT